MPISPVDEFTIAKQRRDALSVQLATFKGKLDSTRDRYNSIMRELSVNHGIGSFDELKAKVVEVKALIVAKTAEADLVLKRVEEQLREIDG